MFPILSRLGWHFPIIGRITSRPLSMQMFGQFEDEELGNWKDHEFIDATPIFAGWNSIDLKASPPFRVKFAYPTTVDVLWMIQGPMGGDNLISKRTMVFRKNQIWRYSPSMKANWTAYPGTSKIWMVQRGSKKRV